MLEDRPVSDVATAVMADRSITESHKKALLQIYRAFQEEAGAKAEMRSKPGPRGTPTSTVSIGKEVQHQ